MGDQAMGDLGQEYERLKQEYGNFAQQTEEKTKQFEDQLVELAALREENNKN